MNVMERFRLDGKRAMITGGSRGLGKEMARALAEAGADLVLVGRDAEVCLNLAEAIDDHDDVQNVYSDFDISDEEIRRIAAEST